MTSRPIEHRLRDLVTEATSPTAYVTLRRHDPTDGRAMKLLKLIAVCLICVGTVTVVVLLLT